MGHHLHSSTIPPSLSLEAVNCFSAAQVQIEVKVGQAGRISLSLCNDCVRKFSDENETHYKKLKVSATRNVKGE
jgi:hypothetical protein